MRYDDCMKNISRATAKNKEIRVLLGGITPAVFLRDYWQKKPLLIRGAMPGFNGLLSSEELAGLACEEDVESRLVTQSKGRWRLEQGPFDEGRFGKLPKKGWTLLVQNVNHFVQQAADLLREFDFIPHARLDDLMVSYAPDGGGVGPHFDSYDVFLLQGQGQRLWRISEQQDLRLVDGAPLRILENFHTEQEWLLEPGDMLYLPPQIAHWGIAVGDCMTYSIGFRAPAAQELVTEFLAYLQEKCVVEGMYADADLEVQRHPAKIGAGMLKQVTTMLKQIQWDESDVTEFLGCYLSEPKPHVVFDKPRAITEAMFRKRLQKNGVRLSGKSQMLFHSKQFFINGEPLEVPESSLSCLKQLADTKYLPAAHYSDDFLLTKLYAWYLAGYLEFQTERGE